MQAKYKKIIYDTIKDLTKLPKEKIIMNYNDKAMPTGDFCRIHFGEISSDEGEEYLDEQGEPIVFFDEEVIIDIFAQKEKDCKLLMQKIKKFINYTKYQYLFEKNNLAYISSSNILDLSTILSDKANTIRYRTQMTLIFRYTEENELTDEDSYDTISKVEGEANLPFNNYEVGEEINNETGNS